MLRQILVLLLMLFTSHAWAEATLNENLVLSEAPINRSDIESIKRGAKFFSANCMTCHTLMYLRYDPIAQEAGITIDKMPLTVKDWPFGVKPPDLSNEVNVRGIDWIYTYLHSFYQDPSRPTGANNLLVPNTAMPNILAPYQGDQALVSAQGAAGILYRDVNWYDLVVLTKQGSMTPEQFDATVGDVVNFLAHASEPYYDEQRKLGPWVLLFLLILSVMAYYLKKEYWKDLKKHKNEP